MFLSFSCSGNEETNNYYYKNEYIDYTQNNNEVVETTEPEIVEEIDSEVLTEETWTYTPVYTYKSQRTCEPYSTIPIICQDQITGVWGTRTCNSDGSGYSRASCPDNFRSFNPETNRLFVLNRTLSYDRGFYNLLYTGVDNVNSYIYLKTITDLFPRETIPESIRAGLQHLWKNELHYLKNVLLIGKPRNDFPGNITELTYAEEMPLYYVDVPPSTASNDSIVETQLPTTWAYSYLRGDLPTIGTRFWTPGSYHSDINVGLIPISGRKVSCEYDEFGNSILETCKSDFEVFAEKLLNWKPDNKFIVSQMDGASCNGQNWGVTKNNYLYDGITRNIVHHDCSDGTSGQIGPIASADNADLMLYFWHGSPSGSSDPNGYIFNFQTKFGGIAVGESCSTAAPDVLPISLGEAQLSNPDGAIAYIGYSRIAYTIKDPFERAFIAGRYTLGDVVNGNLDDMLDKLGYRVTVKDFIGTILYGDPSMIVAPTPKKKVVTKESKKDKDGNIYLTINVSGVNHATVMSGGIELGTIDNNLTTLKLEKDFVDTSGIISIKECDVTKETCQAAGFNPERVARFSCDNIIKTGDNNYVIELESNVNIESEDISIISNVITLNCEEGVSSNCYLDNWDGRSKNYEIGLETTDKIYQGTNYLDINLESLEYCDYEYFRGIRIQAKSKAEDLIGECWVPMNLTLAENMNLL